MEGQTNTSDFCRSQCRFVGEEVVVDWLQSGELIDCLQTCSRAISQQNWLFGADLLDFEFE